MKIILAALFVGLTSSCGVSGGSSDNGGETQKKVHSLPESSTVRKMTSGDYWKYKGTTNYSTSGKSYDLEKTVIISASSNDLNSANYYLPIADDYLPLMVSSTQFKYVDKSNSSFSQQSFSDYFVSYNDTDYMVLYQGMDSGLYPVNEGKGFGSTLIDSAIKNKSSSIYYTANNCRVENGIYVLCTLPNSTPDITGTNIVLQLTEYATLIGTEEVETSFGTFECFKIKIDSMFYSNVTSAFVNGSSSDTVWVYPPIGIIKFTGTYANTNQVPTSYSETTYTLAETNISEY